MTLEDIVKRDFAGLLWAKQTLEAELHVERKKREDAEKNLSAALAQIDSMRRPTREAAE